MPVRFLKSLFRGFYSLIILACGLATLSSCSDAEPLIEDISSLTGMISFSGKNSADVKIPFNLRNAAHVVAGNCDMRVKSIELSINGGTFVSPTSNSFVDNLDWDCSADGSFKVAFTDVGAALSLSSIGDSATVEVRGNTLAGITQSSKLRYVVEGAAAGPSLASALSGSQFSAGTQFKIKTRIGLVHDGKLSEGTKFKVYPK